jgi:hypothetical protein
MTDSQATEVIAILKSIDKHLEQIAEATKGMAHLQGQQASRPPAR